MKPDVKNQKITLQKRELELQRLIRQMKLDQLHKSSVYRNLEQELATIKTQLTVTEQEQKNI